MVFLLLLLWPLLLLHMQVVNPTVLLSVVGLCWRAVLESNASNNHMLEKLNGFCAMPCCAVAVAVTLVVAFAVSAKVFVVDVAIAVAVASSVAVAGVAVLLACCVAVSSSSCCCE